MKSKEGDRMKRTKTRRKYDKVNQNMKSKKGNMLVNGKNQKVNGK